LLANKEMVKQQRPCIATLHKTTWSA